MLLLADIIELIWNIERVIGLSTKESISLSVMSMAALENSFKEERQKRIAALLQNEKSS